MEGVNVEVKICAKLIDGVGVDTTVGLGFGYTFWATWTV
jgi:hypothetical protein